jgi:hypothetical protein
MGQSTRQLSILLLCDDWPGHANTVLDHIAAFGRYSRHQVRTFNPSRMGGSLLLDLNEFDAVVIHYSLVLSEDRYVSASFRDKLRRYRGLKVQFMQDEYRWVDRATAATRDAGVSLLFTAAPEPAAGLLYDERLPGVRRVLTLTGYVPDNLQGLTFRPLAERTVDVGYRGRDLPYWLGRLTQEKVWIAERFLERSAPYHLNCDIGWLEGDRIYGDAWVEFLSACRATLGTESGASIADFDGAVEKAVRAYLRAHPAATYEEVHEAVLKPYEGNVTVNVISPRVFEALSLGTGLIMFPGEYSGIVRASEHYLALEKDFSNLDQVVAGLRDDSFMESMVTRAQQEVIESGRWSYRAFVEEFDRVVAEEAEHVKGPRPAPRRRLALVERALLVPPPRVRLYRGIFAGLTAITGWDLSRRADNDPTSYVGKGMLALRAALGDSDLRALFREGRRAGLAFDRLLEEILELSLLRQAAAGTLATADRFWLTTKHDAGLRSLRFISRAEKDADPTARGTATSSANGPGTGLDLIEWDHRAMGGLVQLQRPRLEVAIGLEGVERFELLAEIGRRSPPILERALAPLLAATQPSRKELS